MKPNFKKIMIAAVILATLMINQVVSAAPLDLAVASGPVSQLMYDNFDDNVTDTSLWSVGQTGGPAAVETNQRLEITLPANSAGAKFSAAYYSACLLRGDFDIQVDYQLLTWPTTNGVRISLSTTMANMERVSFGSQNDFAGGPEVYLADFAGTVMGTTTASGGLGKLRLQRVGTTVTGFYFMNDGWVAAASKSDPTYSQDTAFALGSWSHDPIFANQEVKLAFDNLTINAGELVCAPVSVTIDQAPGQADPSDSSPILFTAIFSSPVTGFGDAAADVTLSGTAGPRTVTVTEAAPNDGTTYTVAVSGMTESGTVIASIPAGAAVDAQNNANAASSSSDNSVTYNAPASGQVTPTTTTCAQFVAGTAPDLETVSYNLVFSKKARVSEVSASSFDYYSKVTAPAASFRIRVVQSINLYGWPKLLLRQQQVFDANCKVATLRSSTKANYIDFTVTNATPGAEYYVHLRYLASSVLGAVVTYPYPTVPYRFTTILNEYHLISSSVDTIYFQPR